MIAFNEDTFYMPLIQQKHLDQNLIFIFIRWCYWQKVSTEALLNSELYAGYVSTIKV